MDICELVHFAKAYRDLGWAVQAQLDDLLLGEGDIDDLNPNALSLIRDFIKDCIRGGIEDANWLIVGINTRLSEDK